MEVHGESITSTDELLAYGDHLYEARQVLAACGLTLGTFAGEVGAHVDVERARAILTFLQETLKPVCEAFDAQLAELNAELQKASMEVTNLEQAFSIPEAQERPGANGYL